MDILIVDDDPQVRVLLRALLEAEDFTVHEAVDGEAGWEAFQEREFHLVITDWMMPRLTGPGLIRRIREVKEPGYAYVILLTSLADESSLLEGLEAGADDFLNKPFNVNELIARLRSGKRVVELHNELLEQYRRVTVANEVMDQDLRAAARVQRAHFPLGPLEFADWHFAWSFIPCQHASGDMLNVLRLDEDTVGMYLIDVAGHGVAPAMLSVTVSRFLTPVSGQASLVKRPISEPPYYEIVPPSEVISLLRGRFPYDERSGLYFTMIYALLNLRTGRFRWVSAGHVPPMVVRRSGVEVFNNQAAGYPIGLPVAGNPDVEVNETVLEMGDRLCLYTDGLTDAESQGGDEFSEDRLVDVLRSSHGSPLRESLDGAVGLVQGWMNGAPFQDDVTLIAVERSGCPGTAVPGAQDRERSTLSRS